MRKLRLAVASEPMLGDYRETLIKLLGLKLDAYVLDMNVVSKWHTKEELVANCIEKIVSGSVDFVVLVSQSGNRFQMIANKDVHIRAAPIPRIEYVEEAATIDPNMCEVESTFHDPQSACDLVVKLLRARERIGQ